LIIKERTSNYFFVMALRGEREPRTYGMPAPWIIPHSKYPTGLHHSAQRLRGTSYPGWALN
jgi:hypothetical protein